LSFKVVIPARFAAQRLPGKPLLDIQGKPMLQHTWERACESAAGEVVIATDDPRILDAALSFGAVAQMTSDVHRSGTDRIQEVASARQWSADTIVVNVQGDEPLIPPRAINQVADNLSRHHKAGIATLCETIKEQSEINNPNAVKVVFDKQSYALYFSRAAIPYASPDADEHPSELYHRHVGIYAYRVQVLNDFVNWSPAALEITERLEQLRALAEGVKIHVAVSADSMPAGIDTVEDLEKVRQHLAVDS
jgi:3-deoxy-manno-octulosonate cytidylyltransferase (CMP-KDO synthetase)